MNNCVTAYEYNNYNNNSKKTLTLNRTSNKFKVTSAQYFAFPYIIHSPVNG